MHEMIYEGKAKKLWSTNNPEEIVLEFKNDLTAFNALKKGQFEGKGEINCEISTLIFNHLLKHNISLHYINTFEKNKMLVRKTQIIPLEVVVRNRIAGSLAKKFKFTEGEYLKSPLVEFYYKNDELQDPFVSDQQIFAFGWCDQKNLDEVKSVTLKINSVLVELFKKAGLSLVDFKIEFGLLDNKKLVLADEISPDSMRIWDMETSEKLDKDRFRHDLGDVKEGYLKILNKLKKVL